MSEAPLAAPSARSDSLFDPRLANFRVVLSHTQHPGNIGSTARAMMNMGLRDLALVEPERYPHPQARAQASGALVVLEEARVCKTLEEAVADCAWVVGTSARARHLGDEPLTPEAFAEQAVQRAVHGKVALVFGYEQTGLTNEELDRCNAVVAIPTNPGYSSLNLAQAVQVLCYVLRRAAIAGVPRVSTKGDHPWYQPPTAEQVEQFYEHLETVLLATGFLDPDNPRLLMRRLRTLFNRSQPDLNELNLLRGILTTVEKPKRRRNNQHILLPPLAED
ncbi:MAG: RNA methyltransferase [Stagnimonas sp.]|nr:RNA methyltransferase [Stagnimonas sp.]